MGFVSELSEEELWAYSRQLVLNEIGYEGQLRLREGRVLLAGAGGLGSPVALQLAAMGAGFLRIVDRDIVSGSDLHRQYLYDAASVGLLKVEVASSRLAALNSRVMVEPVPASIKSWNVEELIQDVDVVVDGLDSMETRYLINRACVRKKIPYIFCGAISTQGNISTIIPGKTPCLECFISNLRDDDFQKCAVVGVYTPILGIVASIEVSEAVRLLTGKEPVFGGILFYIDISDGTFLKVSLVRNEKCPVCGSGAKNLKTPSEDVLVEEQCSRRGERSLVVTPKKHIVVDIENVVDLLSRSGYQVDAGGRLGATLTEKTGITVTIMKTGVAIIQLPQTATPINDVEIIRKLIVDTLELPMDAYPV
jgi:adenylyltransferase/sulfurtransferase